MDPWEQEIWGIPPDLDDIAEMAQQLSSREIRDLLREDMYWDTRMADFSATATPIPMRRAIPEYDPQYSPEYAPDYVPRYAPEDVPEYVPRYAPEDVPEYAPDYVPEYVPKYAGRQWQGAQGLPPGTTGKLTELQRAKREEELKRYRRMERARIYTFLTRAGGKFTPGSKGKLAVLQKRKLKEEMLRIQQQMERKQLFWSEYKWREYKQFLLGRPSKITPDIYNFGARPAYQLKQAQDKPPAPSSTSTEMSVVAAVQPGEKAPPPGTNDARAVSETTGKLTESQKEKEERKILQEIDHGKLLQQKEQPSHSQGTEITETHPIKQQTEPPGTQKALLSIGTGEGIDVDSTNAAALLPGLFKILKEKTSAKLWHKITVKTPMTDRRAVILAINKQVAPLKFVPYFFRMEDGRITFLVSNCNNALFTLIKSGLKIPIGARSFPKIELVLKLRFKNIDLGALLHDILKKRLDPGKKFVDLSYMNHMPEFQEIVYDPSAVTYILRQLVVCVPVVAPGVVCLSLAGNQLSSVGLLSPTHKEMKKSLKVLDLSSNRIRSFTEMAIFKEMALSELHLDQNPVCGQYKDQLSYISVIKANFPRLLKLDGTYLHKEKTFPCWKPNYVYLGSCDNSAKLANQFVELFFALYDKEDRSCLRGLYHKNALFSLCSMYLSGQTTTASARLSDYVRQSRNLLRGSNKGKMSAALGRGVVPVLARLAKLPRTQHDPYSFTVDLLYNTGTYAALTVTGVFRETDTTENVSLRHFMRTFVLIALPDEEYQIVNDMMYVTNAATLEAEEAFMYTKPPAKLRKQPRVPLTDSAVDSMVNKFSKLTSMTTEWSRKCLSDCDWDVKDALEVFVELYKEKQIPEEAFITHAPQQAVKA